jgi:hypothetical protein
MAKIRVELLKFSLQIIFPELRMYNYEFLAEYDALPGEILKTQDLPPCSRT